MTRQWLDAHDVPMGVVRNDYLEKPGGDIALVQTYLEGIGGGRLVPCRESNSQEAPLRCAVVANVDRYFEFAETVARLQARTSNLIIAPIHHPEAGIRAYAKHADLSGVSRIGRVIQDPAKLERLRHLGRTKSFSSALRSVASTRSVIAHSLSAHEVLVQAPSEAVELRKTFSCDLDATFIPNPIGFVEKLNQDRDIDVISVGRIEPRKNQLRLAQALAGSGYRVLFLGSRGRDLTYCRKLEEVVERDPRMTLLPSVSLADLRYLLGRSRVCVGISFMEVVSLAQLDAVGHGAQLLTTCHSYSRDYFGPYCSQVDPLLSGEELRSEVSALLARGINRDGIEHLQSSFPADRARDEFASLVARMGRNR